MVITVEDVRGKVDTFTVAPEHLFLTPAATWHTIAGFKVGDKIASTSGKPVTITSIKGDASERDVYNLTVNEDHSYAVGELGVWSHNGKRFGRRKIGPSGKPMIHIKKHPSFKKSKDASRNTGGSVGAVCHPSPKRGRRHTHPVDRFGNIIKNGVHNEF